MRRNFVTAAELEMIALPADEAYNLPQAAYTSSSIFELEREHVFNANWVNVAHICQVPNVGDYLCVDVFDHPLVVTRTKDGEVCVMSRVCRHKGTLIAEGEGNAAKFVCPFHAWSYALDGELVAAPLMDQVKNFERADCRLPQVRMEIWEGFVFVNMSGEAKPLGPQLEGLRERCANWCFAELELAHRPFYYQQAQNWKINAESFLESYHHLGAHAKTFQPTYPAANGYPIESTGSYSVFSFGQALGGLEKNIDGGLNLPFIEALTAAERMEPMVVFVWPSLLLGVGTDQVAYYRIMPTDAEGHDLWLNDLMPRTTVQDPTYREAIDARVKWATTVVHETDDMPVFDRCHRGIRSPFYNQGRLAFPYERCLWEFNQWWAEQLGERVLNSQSEAARDSALL